MNCLFFVRTFLKFAFGLLSSKKKKSKRSFFDSHYLEACFFWVKKKTKQKIKRFTYGGGCISLSLMCDFPTLKIKLKIKNIILRQSYNSNLARSYVDVFLFIDVLTLSQITSNPSVTFP